jgi:preprotein translocase subunit SecD
MRIISAVLITLLFMVVYSCAAEPVAPIENPAPSGKAIQTGSAVPAETAVSTAPPKKDTEWKDVLYKKQVGLYFQIVKISKSPVKRRILGYYSKDELQKTKDAYAAYVAELKAGKNPKEPKYEWHEANLSSDSGEDDEKINQINKTGLILINYEESPEEEIPTRITGSSIAWICPTVDEFMRPALGFEMDESAKIKFGAMTEKYKGSYMAIVINGVVRSAPVIQSRIDGSGIIRGEFTQEEIDGLVELFKPCVKDKK